MFFSINLFIIYFFSFIFNKLYFNIFLVFKNSLFIAQNLYSTYAIKKKFYYLVFSLLMCILIFCKIFFFIYFYLLIFCKIFIKVYINNNINLKKKNKKIIDFLFFLYWYNLLLHLNVLSKKYQKKLEVDFAYFTLKWNCYYYYYYIIYMLQDLVNTIIWLIQQVLEFQWYVLYLQIIFYFKNKKLECIYYITLFIKGFLGIYCFSGIKNYFKELKNSLKWNTYKKKKKEVGFVSKVKFKYHRSIRIIKEKFYSKVKKPIFILNYSINNIVESVFYVLLKTGANSLVYYFYKVIKYSYSICVYIWKSDLIYRFFKFIERKKW